MGLCPKPASLLLIIISLALVAKLSEAHDEVDGLGDKYNVEITNALGAVGPMVVHCKSKDNDLGAHTVPFTASWGFSFTANAIGTTRFFCSFAWGNESHNFDIFDQDRDSLKCRKCAWKIFTNGACRLKENTSDIDLCYKFH